MYRIAILAVIFLTITSGIYYKISTLNNKIDNLTKLIEVKETSIVNLKLANKLNTIEVKKLHHTIATQNAQIDAEKIDYSKRIITLTKELSQQPKVIYKTIYKKIHQVDEHGKTVDYSKATCKEGLLLNRAIANIKFKDL